VRRGRLVACVCLLGLFVAALVTALDYSLIDALGPGPGFFPFWLSLIGSALTLAILFQTARSADDPLAVVPRERGGPSNPGLAGNPLSDHTLQRPPGLSGRPVKPGDDKPRGREDSLAVIREKPGDDEPSHILPDRRAALQAASVLVALGAAALLMEPLGFRLTMLAFIAGLLAALGARSPAAILITALAGSFGVFHVFYYWLKVPLPIGLIGV
jgi:putative tricarboxylic transport membrane protein